MKNKRADILLPQETAREAVRRRKLLRLLESDNPAWKDADHPELRRMQRSLSVSCGRRARGNAQESSAARHKPVPSGTSCGLRLFFADWKFVNL